MDSGGGFDVQAERRRAAVTRDYTTPAVITLILYFILWLPGAVANVVYYLQARNDEALAGTAPQGKGCLLALLIVFLILPLVGGVLGACILVGALALGSA